MTDEPSLDVEFRSDTILKKKRISLFCALKTFCFVSLLLSTGYLTYLYFSCKNQNHLNSFYESDKTPKLPTPPPPPPTSKCQLVADSDKFDCFPRNKADEKSCLARGCCWDIPKNRTSNEKTDLATPYCYYPTDYTLYKYENHSITDFGETGFLKSMYSSPYPNDVQVLQVDVKYETETRLHIKIFDPNNKRFEPPYPELPVAKTAAKSTQYIIVLDKNRFGFSVVRKSDKKSIFDCLNIGGFTFADQFLQLSAKIPTNNVYGLGQHRDNFHIGTNWQLMTFFNRDQPPVPNSNLYGTHPFYIGVEDDGKSSGVLLFNSNAMDVILQPTPAVTFRTIGGILDFYFFVGPTPTEVIQQYLELVGSPAMPPYWGLGFHLCRWGYHTLNNTKAILDRNRALGIPVNVQWNDIDYMDKRNDFTYDKVNFKGINEFVDELHNEGLHYVIIVDPGISASEPAGTYPPYEDAIAEDILVKDYTGKKPFMGRVWNLKTTVFPDFTHPKALQYWQKQITRQHHEQFKFDGIWIDMNEPANIIDGSLTGCPDGALENPPYTPRVSGNLTTHTLCMTAQFYKGSHYNIHNLFSISEAINTNFALKELTNKRPFIISRATFVGQGKYSGHWSGDNFAKWEDMRQSIADMLNMNIFGIPLTGADICGFNMNTTIPLCQRWHQLGAFYPFSRNHNSIDQSPQDPASLGPEVVNSTRDALKIRYTLLPYLYTLFFYAHTNRTAVARSLAFEFPSDLETFKIDSQFLWGSALHIIPVLDEGATSVKGYLPKARWFDYHTKKEIPTRGSYFVFDAPLNKIPLALRGGYIIPTQVPASTTTQSRKNKMGLIVILDDSNRADGALFWDDGESIDTYERNEYNYLKFNLINRVLNSTVSYWKYETELVLGYIDILGVKGVSSVLLNGKEYENFMYDNTLQYLQIRDLTIDLQNEFSISYN